MSNILKQKIDEMGLSVRQASIEMNIPYSTLSDIINGKSNIEDCQYKTLNKISAFVGVHIDDMLQSHPSIGYTYKTGSSLRLFIQRNTSADWNMRDFVDSINIYDRSNRPYILGICGLRGTGKTTGLLQFLSKKDPDEAIYIACDGKGSASANDVIKCVEPNLKTLKWLAIDEYTWFKGREKLDDYIWQLVQHDIRVAITGTESITIQYLNVGNLIHRLSPIHTTKTTYDEYCRVHNVIPSAEAVDEYLNTGGVFGEYINSEESIGKYIETAIVNPLCDYLGDRVDYEHAKALVYTYLYNAIISSYRPDKDVDVERYIKVPGQRDDMKLRLFDRFGIDADMVLQQSQLDFVGEVFQKLELVVKVPNYIAQNETDIRYYLTNPSLCTQLCNVVFGEDRADASSKLGYVFESACITQASSSLKGDDELYYVEKRGDDAMELDIIIKNHDTAYIFECKHKQEATLNQSASILKSQVENLLPDHDIKRYVIYRGEYVNKTLQTRAGEAKDVTFIPPEAIAGYDRIEKRSK